MVIVKELQIPGYEKVVEIIDAPTGLHGFISIHSTKPGPSLGGLRMLPYASREEALADVLKLSKAMSYKSALAGTGLGGGKSVLIGSPKKDKTKELLLAYGEALNQLEGDYIAAEDVGTTTADMMVIHQKSPHVAALPQKKSSGDPSRFTAFGILKGMEACAEFLFGSPSLKGKRVAIQGLGNVGCKLAHFLFWQGAELIYADLDEEHLEKCNLQLGGTTVSAKEILTVPCDFFAPCALGGVLNPETIPHLKCKAIAGSANNQLSDDEMGKILLQQGILYAPDFVVNAGGIINASQEFAPGGYNPNTARERTENIYQVLLEIFKESKKNHAPTNAIANRLAESKLEK
jgi:leucine dehydrogenase